MVIPGTRKRHRRGAAAAAAARPVLRLALLAAAAALLAAPAGAAYNVAVEFGQEMCFVVRCPGKGSSVISGNFDLLSDELSAHPLEVALYDVDDKATYHSTFGQSEGKFSVPSTGRNFLCVKNGQNEADLDDESYDRETRVVGFSVRVRPLNVHFDIDGEGGEGPETEVLSDLIDLSEDLLDDFQDLSDHQAYLKVREAEHRDLTEATFSRILRWTVLEALVVVGIAGGQVLYLKKFFEKKRYM